MRTPWLGANWKMNGDTALIAGFESHFVDAIPGSDICVFPPFPYLAAMRGSAGWRLGAQDLSVHANGAYTGEVSAAMLREVGAEYVLVGHSERRQLHGESDATVALKLKQTLNHGLRPVLCIGETLEQRESGATETILAAQLNAVLSTCTVSELSTMVIAYEPVWAIGTGRTATPEQAQSVHRFIRSKVAIFDAILSGLLRIAYGGSVKSANARALFEQADIDGGLVGGASLNAEEFLGIAQALAVRHPARS